MAQYAIRRISSCGEERASAVRALVLLIGRFEALSRALPISLSRYRRLLHLLHGPKRASELADRAEITRPALSALIASLDREGLIKRRAVESDKRGVRLELTRKGADSLARAEAVFGSVFEGLLDDRPRGSLFGVLGDVYSKLVDAELSGFRDAGHRVDPRMAPDTRPARARAAPSDRPTSRRKRRRARAKTRVP
jgi:DNA-binding MarR family transcriptional regulator